MATPHPPPPPRYDPPLPRQERYPIYAGSAPEWNPRMKYPPPQSIYDTPVIQATNDWEVGLFECLCTPIHCTCALLFPFLSAAYTAHWANRSAVVTGFFFLVLYAADVIVSVESELSVSLVISAFYLAGVLALRHTVREIYRIRGSSLGDFFAAFCCSCCALSQMSAHTSRIKRLREAQCVATLPAYHVVSGTDNDEEWLRRDEQRDVEQSHEQDADAAYKALV